MKEYLENPERITPEIAKLLYDSEWWVGLYDEEIVEVQVRTPYVCVPTAKYVDALQSVLGRPIWIHEIACPTALQAEVVR